MMSRKVLVTGGQRSGKSAYAESLLRQAAPDGLVYLAPGPVPDPEADPEWAARVAAHQARRPASWRTVETVDVTGALGQHAGPVLVDCLGTWLSAVLDDLEAWTTPPATWSGELERRVAGLSEAWSDHPGPAVAVTNEVGLGLVSEHRSGRIFVDHLGRLNQRIAAASDDVVLVVAGRTLHL